MYPAQRSFRGRQFSSTSAWAWNSHPTFGVWLIIAVSSSGEIERSPSLCGMTSSSWPSGRNGPALIACGPWPRLAFTGRKTDPVGQCSSTCGSDRNITKVILYLPRIVIDCYYKRELFSEVRTHFLAVLWLCFMIIAAGQPSRGFVIEEVDFPEVHHWRIDTTEAEA